MKEHTDLVVSKTAKHSAHSVDGLASKVKTLEENDELHIRFHGIS